MMSKTECAFRLSCEKFFEEQKRVYFWAFTCRKVHPDWYYSQIWSRFFRELQDLHGGTLQGLKVVELHESHGIHWHCLLNTRVCVHQVRRIGRRYGIGRVHAQPANRGAIDYLAKYVSKDMRRPGQQLFARVARWNCIGHFKGVRKGNLVVTGTQFCADVQFAKQFLGVSRVPFHVYHWLRAHPHADRQQFIAMLSFNRRSRRSVEIEEPMRKPRNLGKASQLDLLPVTDHERHLLAVGA